MISQTYNQDLVQYFESIVKGHNEYSFFITNQEEYEKIHKITDLQFINHLLDQFSQKNIVYIRHAESPINVWVSKNPIKFMLSLYPPDPQLYNPGITEIGKSQCNNLQKILNMNNSKQIIEDSEKENSESQNNNDLPDNYDLVIVSPYQRTITTFDEIKESEAFKSSKVLASSLIRERATIPASVVGFKTSCLQSERVDINCDYLNKEKWWKLYQQHEEDSPNSQIEVIKRESNIELQFRVLIFLIWITLRDEKNIVFFSHCAVYEAIKLFKVKKPSNAIPYIITKHDLLTLYKQFFKGAPNL